jgi:hypothetical protein
MMPGSTRLLDTPRERLVMPFTTISRLNAKMAKATTGAFAIFVNARQR